MLERQHLVLLLKILGHLSDFHHLHVKLANRGGLSQECCLPLAEPNCYVESVWNVEEDRLFDEVNGISEGQKLEIW